MSDSKLRVVASPRLHGNLRAARLSAAVFLASAVLAQSVVATSEAKKAGKKSDATAASAKTGGDTDEPTVETLPTTWTVLHLANPRARGRAKLSKRAAVENLSDFKFTGPRPGDPFLLGDVEVDGEWGLVDGVLQRTGGKATALRLGRVGDFEMEGILEAEGTGGWYFLVGMDKGHGYAVYNVTTRSSGSPWLTCEFRNKKGIDSTHREFVRHEWKGREAFRMSIIDKKLSVQVGRTKLTDDVELPNYHEGDLILGTYDTKYGPKPVKIRSLRIRAR